MGDERAGGGGGRGARQDAQVCQDAVCVILIEDVRNVMRML